MMIVGIPYLVTEVLELETELANQLCGFAEGALAAGGLAGGICAGIFAKRLKFSQAGNQIMLRQRVPSRWQSFFFYRFRQ